MPPNHALKDNQSQPILLAQVGASDAHAAEDGTHADHAEADTHGSHTEQGHGPAHTIAMILSILIAGLGILLSALFYYWKTFSAEKMAATFRPIYTLFWNKYYFDEFYNGVIVASVIKFARGLGLIDLRGVDGIVNGVGFTVRAIFAQFAGWFDNTFVDGLVNRVAKVILSIGSRVRHLQTGMIQNYLLVILGGVVLLILIFRTLL